MMGGRIADQPPIREPRQLTGGHPKWEDAHVSTFEAEIRYVEGFKMAAEVLVDHVYGANDVASWADSLVYPIGYLLRHYVELKMKSVLRALGHEPKRPDHDLLKLWATMRDIGLRFLPPDRSDAEQEAINARFAAYLQFRDYEALISLKQAEAIVAELHELDPSGEGFRYPFKRDGSRTLPGFLTHVDLKRWLGRVLSLGAFLDGVETAVYEHNRQAAEIREYYSD